MVTIVNSRPRTAQSASPLHERVRLIFPGQSMTDIDLVGWSFRLCQSFLQRPLIQAFSQCRRTNAQAISPFLKTQSLITKSDHPIVALVARLLTGRCPAAIFRLVIALRVWMAIQAFTGRLFSHVREEVCKGTPTFTDSDSRSAVLRIGAMLRVCAASDHARPRVVRRAHACTRGVAVLRRALRCHFALQAATRPRNAMTQGNARDALFCATSTTTPPLRLPFDSIFSAAEHGPAPEGLSSHINYSFHDSTLIIDLLLRQRNLS